MLDPAYRLVYDASRLAFPAWRVALPGLLAGALGALLLRARAARWIGTTLAIFGPAWTVVMGAGLYGEHARLRRALATGNAGIVEGVVHDRPPGDGSAWVVESGPTAHWYRYSASPLAAGYHRARPGDGGLRDGDVVRLADVDGAIARLEVRAP